MPPCRLAQITVYISASLQTDHKSPFQCSPFRLPHKSPLPITWKKWAARHISAADSTGTTDASCPFASPSQAARQRTAAAFSASPNPGTLSTCGWEMTTFLQCTAGLLKALTL